MGNFKIGEKVVCVDPSYSLVKGDIYEIKSISNCKCGAIGFELNNIYKPFKNEKAICCHCYNYYKKVHVFDSKRFRKLDYEFAENLLAEISEARKSETIKN